MPFIPIAELEHRAVGQWVRLKINVDVLSGRFTAGTLMKIIADGPRGLDLEDENGNRLLETGLRGTNFYEPASAPNNSYWQN